MRFPSLLMLLSIITALSLCVVIQVVSAALNGQTGQWPSNLIGFEFQIIDERNPNYYVIVVTRVHNLPSIHVGDKLILLKPKKLVECELKHILPVNKLIMVRILGFIEMDGQRIAVIEVKPEQETSTFSISGTVYPGYINAHGYHYLYESQRVSIVCNWSSSSQPMYLGLIYWDYRHFYAYLCYDGYAEISMQAPYEGFYSMGVGNPLSNSEPIGYNGYYTLHPLD